jgi:hypothetical protein
MTRAGRVAERPLENTANNSATAGHSVAVSDYRAVRWEARGLLWAESSIKRVRKCGRYSVLPDGSVGVRSNGQAVGYAGLASCGSVWACPVCNAKVQAVRRLEVGTLLALATVNGSAAFGAYTLRHYAGQDLDVLWRALSKCWAAVGRDGSVKRLRARLGWIGYVRATECTIGACGWHPHVHPLHLFAGQVTTAQVDALHAVEFRAWQAAALRLGLSAPLEDAQHLHLVLGDAGEALGDYFTKATYAGARASSVGWEMTSTQTKSRTRASDSRTPWEVLGDIAGGDADSLDLWHAWEAASKGKKALTYSRGLRERFGLLQEATDEEIAEAEVGSQADTGFIVTDWAPVRARPVLGAQLLAAVGTELRWGDGRRFCRANGIDFREVGE